MLTIKSNEKVGTLVNISAVDGVEDLLVITLAGIVIRTPLSQVKIAGRNTQGVRIIKLEGKQRVASIAIVDHLEEGEEEFDELAEEENINQEENITGDDDAPIDLSHEKDKNSNDEE